MHASDRRKLKKAGFRIFRERRDYTGLSSQKFRYEIWELANRGSWVKYSENRTQAAHDKVWKELMRDDKNIAE